ncbi:Polyadenylate-binding protein/Hyperplastic disc protein [Tuber magnatum]|uniref:Polyadenylate-binding protein/Hyperplastic disc protein n=1 Tax=Tuber magnatum TaxID=42249 RepID=A0A317SS40_9PEZI|nr:Polyadenylate-binding protein/Hyperplastic disc protein [Tuber magnatum]
MNQRMVNGKPLYVALAQRKDVRKSQLEASIQARNQIRMQQQAAAAGMQPAGFLNAQMYYGPGQQTGFMPQGGRGLPFPQPSIMPMAGGPQGGPGGPGSRGPQAGNFAPNTSRSQGPIPQGIPQQMYGPPAMGPGAGPGGPGFAPYPPNPLAAAQAQAVVASQQGRGRGGVPPAGMAGLQQGMANMSMGPRGPVQPGRGGPRANLPPQTQPGRPPVPPQIPHVSASGIDPALFAASPPHAQKQLLGESLYPKIQRQHPELAGKITGMLLEMDNMELLALLDDEQALIAKVDEALSVYDEYVKTRTGDDIGGHEGTTTNDNENKGDEGKKEGEIKG